MLTSAKLDATGHHWLAELSLYDFSIKYQPELKNVDADGLSQSPQETISEENVRSFVIVYCLRSQTKLELFESIRFKQLIGGRGR